MKSNDGENMVSADDNPVNLTAKQILLLKEELDIDDEMNEEDEKPIEDDPYFLLAQRLANAPQVKVNQNVQEEGEVLPGNVEDESSERHCPVCNKVEEDVVSHFKQSHPDVEGVVCPHCCKLLSKKCTLNRHIEQVHLGLQIFKPAKCDECGKVFSKKGHLDRHVRTIHMGMKDESEPCPHCGKIFTTKSSLEPHIEAVHKGIRRECKICGKVLSDLWKHMRTVHGQYRRKVKIPKDEVFGTSSLSNSSMNDSSFAAEPPSDNSMLAPKIPSSPNKRKSSSPLKVKLPFKSKTKDDTSSLILENNAVVDTK